MERYLIEEDAPAEGGRPRRRDQADIKSYLGMFIGAVVIIAIIVGIIILSRHISQSVSSINPEAKPDGTNGQNNPSPLPPPATMPLPSVSGGGGGAPSGGTASAPRLTAPDGMTAVPAGEYVSAWLGDKQPIKSFLAAFYIDTSEVTNWEYYQFVKATGHKVPTDPRGIQYNIWTYDSYPPQLAKHPVVNISYQDAESYANWKGKRLPTQEEWEKASRGSEGFIFPWGNQTNPAAANCRANGKSRGTLPVGSFPLDRSPYGVSDLAGNVREWTSSPYGGDPKKRWKVVKGGSFETPPEELTSYNASKGTLPAPDLGFRCAMDAQ